MQRIIAFDTETTGLFYKNNPPYMTQLAFVVYDVRFGIQSVYSQYIQLPPGVGIPTEVQHITGITPEMCEGGVSLLSALTAFRDAAATCDTVVAHNIGFDRRVLAAARNRVDVGGADLLAGLEPRCTMIEGIGKLDGTMKRPKLIELYMTLFGVVPRARLHCARADTLYCLACFLHMQGDFSGAQSAIEFAEAVVDIDDETGSEIGTEIGTENGEIETDIGTELEIATDDDDDATDAMSDTETIPSVVLSKHPMITRSRAVNYEPSISLPDTECDDFFQI